MPEPYPPPNKTALEVAVDWPKVPPETLIVVVVEIVPDVFDPPNTAPFICPPFTFIVVEPYILFWFAPPYTFLSIVPPKMSTLEVATFELEAPTIP